MAVDRRIQVALSGSGFLLPVHVGALQAIHAAGFTVSAFSNEGDMSIHKPGETTDWPD